LASTALRRPIFTSRCYHRGMKPQFRRQSRRCAASPITRAPSLWPSSIWDTAHNQGGRACCGWDCAASDELSALHIALLAAFRRGNERPFRPHVTIARIRGNGAAIARKQPIDRALAFWQRVETVKLIQSPPSGEVGYCVLAAFKLGKPAASVTTG
jgi:hypothetical protein